ncbi:LOW QUALITY PROTEIN: adenylate cyclase type 10-like [Urocitellus parryii]
MSLIQRAPTQTGLPTGACSEPRPHPLAHALHPLLRRKRRLPQLYRQTDCFSLLWRIYSSNNFFHYKFYAVVQVNSALETQNDFQNINAYLDYSLYHQLAGCQGMWFKYELMAMEQIVNLPLKGEGIEIVALMASRLAHIKYIIGHLYLAIELGSRAHKLWSLLRNPNKHYLVLCRFCKSLLLKRRYKQLIQVLGWMWDLSVAEEHIFSKAFFYFVCLDIMLYSGFIYRTFEECVDFICQNENNRILKFQSGILLGLYSCVAIWYTRLQDWDEFHTFSSRAKHMVSRRIPTVLYYEGIARYLEGQVLYLQKQIEQQLENAQDHGVELLKNLESLVAQNTTGPVFYPRLYHLMAYVCILMGDGQNCDLFLNKALRLSETQGNMLEKCWLNMSKGHGGSNQNTTACALTGQDRPGGATSPHLPTRLPPPPPPLPLPQTCLPWLPLPPTRLLPQSPLYCLPPLTLLLTRLPWPPPIHLSPPMKPCTPPPRKPCLPPPRLLLRTPGRLTPTPRCLPLWHLAACCRQRLACHRLRFCHHRGRRPASRHLRGPAFCFLCLASRHWNSRPTCRQCCLLSLGAAAAAPHAAAPAAVADTTAAPPAAAASNPPTAAANAAPLASARHPAAALAAKALPPATSAAAAIAAIAAPPPAA